MIRLGYEADGRSFGVCLFFLSGLLLTGTGLPAAVDREVDYARDVAPIFERHCYKCHGPEQQKSGLRLDEPEGITSGGESGEPVFIRGKSEASHLIRLVGGIDPDEVMPPKGARLSAEEVGILRAWIDGGAALPELEPGAGQIKTDHWSFQPVQRPEVPRTEHPFARNEIDHFVFAKLKERGLSPSPRAEPRTLMRRLYMVMHGLPPSPEELRAFLADTNPDSFQRLIDEVLDSPHYGERWARHWLDVVRYADSNGFETNRERKNAYHYRDYVIEAFNSDKPYDQFIKEQIAGDAMGVDVATGFLVAGPYDIVKSPDISLTLMQRQDELADMINTTGTAFLGLTLGCARCHNHKFDPVVQKDYYSLQAVFAGVTYGDRKLPVTLGEKETGEVAKLEAEIAKEERVLGALRAKASGLADEGGKALRPPVETRRNEEEFEALDARAVRFTIHQSSGAEPCIDELEVFDAGGHNVALAELGGSATASGTLPGYEIHKLEHVNDGRYGNGRSWICNAPTGWVQVSFPGVKRIERIVWARDREGRFRDRLAIRYVIEAETGSGKWVKVASSDDREPYSGREDPFAFLARLSPGDAAAGGKARKRVEELRAEVERMRQGDTVWAGNFQQPQETHRLYRGDPFQKREVVAPDALSVMGTLGLAADAPEQLRRVKLADWIASEKNPLTARVMVNRIWQYIFGTGLAATPSDLGANGVPPTHPGLLDWLADELVRSGWSIKHIQRLILNSHTFQQSSKPDPDGLARDAAGRMLWRFSPRRLEAEAIRDCILAASGVLDQRMGGPGFYLLDVQVENVMHYFPKEKFGPEEYRRMVYMFKVRQEQDAIFGAFDCPDGNQVIPRRSRSNTPLQALNLFNSQFVIKQSGLWAARLRSEAGDSVEAQVERAFALAYARKPDAEEMELSRDLIRGEGLESFCRALYNSSEFLFIF